MEPFYRDPGGASRVGVQDDVPAAARACVDTLRALGMESDRLFVEDFALFAHAGVDAALARFIEQAPGVDLPLVAITVVQYVRAESHVADLAATLAGLQAHADQMTRFAARYNIEVALHIYVQHFSAAAAAAITKGNDSDRKKKAMNLSILNILDKQGKIRAESLFRKCLMIYRKIHAYSHTI